MSLPALVWGPLAAAAPVISGITAAEVATGVMRVAWDLDQVAQGWVAYGTTNGGPYPNESVRETSYLYSSHVQDVPGLPAGTTIYFVVHAVNAAGQASSSAQQSFATAGATVVTYTDFVVPTGAGWTDGSDNIATMQSWFDARPDGTDALNQTRIVFTAGFRWRWSEALNVLGRRWITFWGQGTPVYTVDANGVITANGITGGATIESTSSGSLSGHVGRRSLFAATTYGTTYRATGLYWEGLNFEGPLTILAGNGMGGEGNEHQLGVRMYGHDGGGIKDCEFYRLRGDGFSFEGSAGSAGTDPLDVRTRNVTVENAWVHSVGRVGIFLGKCTGIVIRKTRVEDTAYAHVDFEPDYAHMRIADVLLEDVTLAGGCNWHRAYYMSSIFMTRPTGNSPGLTFLFDGPVTFRRVRWIDRHMRASNGSDPGSNGSGLPEVHGIFGPITKQGLITMEDCSRHAYPHTGPVIDIANATGGVTATNNRGFGVTNPSTSFVRNAGGNGPITQTGND